MKHNFTYHGFIPSSRAIRPLYWKYIQYTDNAAPFEEVYGLRNDPHEVTNLAIGVAHKARLERLHSCCETWNKSFTAGDRWREPLHGGDLES